MTEPNAYSEKINRVNTRAFTREMAAQLTPKGATTRATSTENEQDRGDELRLSILRLIEASASEECLIANLQNLVSQGTTIEAPAMIQEITTSVKDRLPQSDDPEQAESVPALFLRRPSWNGQQPIESRNSNLTTRITQNPKTNRGHPENNYEKQIQGNRSSPTEFEIEKAIETLVAAFGSAFKPPAQITNYKRNPESQKHTRMTAGNETPTPSLPREEIHYREEKKTPTAYKSTTRQDSNSPPLLLPDRDPRKENQISNSPILRPPPGFSAHPGASIRGPGFAAAAETLSSDGPHSTTAMPPRLLPIFTGDPAAQQQLPASSVESRCARGESNIPLTGLRLGLGAAAASSSPDDFQREMSFAHAQSSPAKREEKKMTDRVFCIHLSIPLPYREFTHILGHGQLPSESNYSNNFGTLPINFPKLQIDGENLLEWSQQLQLIFMRENVLFLISEPPKKPWSFEIDCLHRKAFCLLLTSIPPLMYPTIGNNLTVYEVMQKIYSLFYSQSRATTTRISRQFHSARLRPGVPMSEHILKLNATRAELLQRGEIITEESMMSIIINSLDSSWDNFVTQLDSLTMEQISLSTLTNHLIAEDNLRRDRRLSRREPRPVKRVELQDRIRNTQECFSCGSRNHLKRNCPRNHRNKGYTDRRERPEPGRRHQGGRSPDNRTFRERERGCSPSTRRNNEHRDSSRDRHTESMYGFKHEDTNTRQRTRMDLI
ncbi:uncharacterized protein LOC117662578 [Pantherophis guttatus]|uniref:Uncharacterized protein LOC117662578 n=1 Tax=Pantherophis guttatus TaxID=94885 RepID=A0A6P9B9G0_PANGU|nr:uncharacterized protein LOC117662578 [Pantherophis guttatus]XP_034267928.1 uncharacterized protein LOC117662578 [Pantherophis guttatus]